jgi:SAM-dependent methyltransferase
MPTTPPDPFGDTFIAMAAARAIITATRLGVVGALAREPATAAELAQALGLQLAGAEALLTVLDTLGYLEVDDRGAYRPTSAARALVPSEPASLTHFVGAYNAHAWDMLGELDELLRGRRPAASHARPPGDPFWEPYIRGLFELSRSEHDENAGLVPARDPRELLDVAGGHGAFAMAMCRRFPALHATVLDLPASAQVGRRIVAEEGFAARVSVREGDALRDPLGSDLDVISIFNLLHHLPDQALAALLARARAALREGGCLVIGETERPEPGRPATLNGAVSGLVYFASSGTRNYTRSELVARLGEAGFADVRVHRNDASPWRLVYVALVSPAA